jgi:hypothetical protein
MIETLFLSLVAASLIYLYLLRMMFTVRSLEEQVETLVNAKGGATRGT